MSFLFRSVLVHCYFLPAIASPAPVRGPFVVIAVAAAVVVVVVVPLALPARRALVDGADGGRGGRGGRGAIGGREPRLLESNSLTVSLTLDFLADSDDGGCGGGGGLAAGDVSGSAVPAAAVGVVCPLLLLLALPAGLGLDFFCLF